MRSLHSIVLGLALMSHVVGALLGQMQGSCFVMVQVLQAPECILR